MSIFINILLAILVCSSIQATSIFNLVKLTDPSALCLDGTPGAYYVAEGEGANKNKWILYYEGGGWCGDQSLAGTLEQCYQRSFTDLGSSKNYGAQADLSWAGVLSGNPSVNPSYHDWSRVYLKYCDGTAHQGTKAQPIDYKGLRMYFRGHNISVAQLAHLNSVYKIFTDAPEIMVSGCSAGGLAAYHWTNYIFDNAAGKVWSSPDSGIFLDQLNVNNKQPLYRNQFINFMAITNVEIQQPVEECNRKYPDELWKCMFAQYLWEFIKAPLFPLNALYDSWSVPNILGVYCLNGQSMSGCNSDQRAIMQDYRAKTFKVVTDIANKQGNGAWAPACAQHCFIGGQWTSGNFRIPTGSQNSLDKTVSQWMGSGNNNNHIDTVSWPQNLGCAGSHLELQRQ